MPKTKGAGYARGSGRDKEGSVNNKSRTGEGCGPANLVTVMNRCAQDNAVCSPVRLITFSPRRRGRRSLSQAVNTGRDTAETFFLIRRPETIITVALERARLPPLLQITASLFAGRTTVNGVDPDRGVSISAERALTR